MSDIMKATNEDEPRTEYIDGQKLWIEIEDPEEPGVVHSRYDPALIRVDPKVFSLHQILEMLKAGDLDLTPDFQRKKVWTAVQKSRLVESIFLRIPLPAFYFAQDADGLMHVVDGLQRLSTIRDYVDGKFALSGLEYLTEEQLGGMTWDKLSGLWRRRLHTTQISVQVVDPQTPPQVKFQIFLRLNTGGSPLTAHEIRNSLGRGRSRQFLHECAESPGFRLATHHHFDDHPRMADREAVLRVCAFLMEKEIGSYEKHESMEDFLNAANLRLDNEKRFSADQLKQLRRDFDRSMGNASFLFGRHAFCKWPLGVEKQTPINRSLLDSWGAALASYDPAQLAPHKEAIVLAVRTRMRDDELYRAAIANSTSNARKVQLRLKVARDVLTEYVI